MTINRLPLPLFAATLACARAAAPAADRPNIVLIVADDLGYNALGCYGGKVLETPVLDRLAAGGLRCTDFHSNGSVCSPTRAALMTGRYQQRSGVDGVIKAATMRHAGLDPAETTVAEVLRGQGYATAVFGKWHLGYEPRFNPVRQGFDEFRGFVSGNVDQFSFVDQVGYYDWWRQDRLVDDPGYFPRNITDYAIDFIDRHRDRPFFLYLPHAAPHYPVQGPDDPPQRRVTEGDFVPESHAGLDFAGKGGADRESYVAMVGYMDAQIGRLVGHLEARGLAARTLVVFMSDNGPTASHKAMDGQAQQLRGRKGNIYEGGHRVPAIFHWPGRIRAGRTTDQPMAGMDLMPTFMTLAGARDGFERLDGTDLGPVLFAEGALPERDLFWFNLAQREAAVRRGCWKLVQAGKGGAELYDLGSDLAESSDRSGENPGVVAELAAALEKMRAEVARGPRPAAAGGKRKNRSNRTAPDNQGG